MFPQILRAVAGAAVVYLLLFSGLSDTGLLGPDEPRYAAVAREMADSGDWVTPRLWGEVWFEKPALLYWMTAAAFRLGLGEELSPRLPVALMGLAFLVFFFLWLRREFSAKAGWYATAILATSVGWLAFAHLGVTDLPLAATFSAGMLLLLPWIRRGERRVLVPAGVLFGLAVLAKGLVPGVLAIPVLWAGRKRWKDLFTIGAMALVTAAPWYILCTMRNGVSFLEDFFWKHHFERFSTEGLQHVQPFWFYVPVLLAGLVPWTPVLTRLFRRSLYEDERTRFLLLWFAFGFLFLSASTNKLPGYLLPLIPPLCVLLGLALAEVSMARWELAGTALLIAVIPLTAAVLPVAIRSGLSRAAVPPMPWGILGIAAVIAAGVWLAESKGFRSVAVQVLVVAVTAGIVYLKLTALPALDREVSARKLWRQVAPHRNTVCLEPIHRAWIYGLNYYAVTPLASCEEAHSGRRIRQGRGAPAYLSE